jgi:hypothetical protein
LDDDAGSDRDASGEQHAQAKLPAERKASGLPAPQTRSFKGTNFVTDCRWPLFNPCDKAPGDQRVEATLQ